MRDYKLHLVQISTESVRTLSFYVRPYSVRYSPGLKYTTLIRLFYLFNVFTISLQRLTITTTGSELLCLVHPVTDLANVSPGSSF